MARAETNQVIQERHNRGREMLAKHGYRCINGCVGPQATEKNTLEFYTGPKGTIILQFWEDGSVTTFAEWPLGHTWEELEEALQL